MKFTIYLVFLLGLTLKDSGWCSNLIEVLSSPWDLPESRTPENPFSLESIVHTEIRGNWTRALFAMRVAKHAHPKLKVAIYKALWQEFQQSKQVYNPINILDFFEQLEKQSDVPYPITKEVYKLFVERSAYLLTTPFYTDGECAYFPVVHSLLERLTLSSVDYLSDILNIIFTSVLALQSPLSVVQHLTTFSSNLSQLTLAHISLAYRPELQNDYNAHRELLDNVKWIKGHPDFEYEVEYDLREELDFVLPSYEGINLLYSGRKVCLQNSKSYIYECPQTLRVCSNQNSPRQAAFNVMLKGEGSNSINNPQFTFYSEYWNNYLYLEQNIETPTDGINKNVFSGGEIFWWNITEMENGLVALFDGATSGSVLCGGNSTYANTMTEQHVYTRDAREFNKYRDECSWTIEDCSFVDYENVHIDPIEFNDIP